MKDIILAPYILFSTRKRDGSFVPTPVWAAGSRDHLYVFSAGNAGKVKRLRNFSECLVARCTATGKRLSEDLPAEAFLIDGDEVTAAHKALISKYGIQMRLLDLGAKLSGRMAKRQYIRIDLTPKQS
jgi:uncharacterized protein